MKYRWTARVPENEKAEIVKRLQRDLNDLPRALARALMARGVETLQAARRFFRPQRADLHDPFAMAGMEAAAARLAAAIQNKERVLVYGDYDVDGTTSTALMTRFLRTHGAEARYFVPDRFEHGYGLSRAGLDRAAEQGAALVVALDCGVTATAEAAYAREQGLDLIICDHHTPAAALPDALAVLDPKRADCDYPFKALSGCGVGFKLAQATLQVQGAAPEAAVEKMLERFGDLLAVSIAADIVPVSGENRIFLREGLKQLRSDACLGLKALAQAADLDLSGITAGRLVFTLGPRINAAGRLDRADRAVDLLLADRMADARPLARALDELNQQRRTIDRQTTGEAIKKAERYLTARTPHALVLANEAWHQGVVGIVASSVVEHFHRPTVMLTAAGDEADRLLKGSARSIGGVNVYEALDACADLLEQFGGHDYAAGLTLRRDRLDAFRTRFDEAVGQQVTPELLLPAIKVDAPLRLDEIGNVNGRFWAVLKQFAPHGPANARPVFRSRDLALARTPRRVGRDGKHLKFTIRSCTEASAKRGNGQPPPSPALPPPAADPSMMDAIAFGMGDKIDVLRQSQRTGRPLEMAFSVEENTWKGRTSLQLKVRDVRLQQEEDQERR